jgi:hypothetical protein
LRGRAPNKDRTAGVNAVRVLFLEVSVTKSIFSTVALSALVAGSLLAGTAQAQYAAPTGTIIAPGVSDGTAVGGPGVLIAPRGNSVATAPAGSTAGSNIGGIGPGMNGGVGVPIDGLDSNPYAEAPQAARALGYPYHPPAKSATGTMN